MTAPSRGRLPRLRIVNGLPAEAVRIIGREVDRAIREGSPYDEFIERVERRLRAAGLWKQVAIAG